MTEGSINKRTNKNNQEGKKGVSMETREGYIANVSTKQNKK